MQENSPTSPIFDYEPTELSDGADVALNLGDPRLSSVEQGHALAEQDKARLEMEKNGREALERARRQAEEFLKTEQGRIGWVAELTTKLRRERAQADYDLAAE